MSDLKPCPFCGSNNLKPAYHSPYVICGDCKALGPGSSDITYDEAVEAWNTRMEQTCSNVSVDTSSQFYCSECECTVEVPLLWGEINFCPNCGKKVER